MPVQQAVAAPAARLFGTDGVRGLANVDVTAELALDLAVAAAHVLADVGEFAGHRPRAVVGRDPRASGEFLSAATCAGLASAGVDVEDVGVLPTPGIAHHVAATGADLGVMISASHNPMPDNGIKFFARGGHKLPDDLEDAIEARLREPWDRPTGAEVGRITASADASERYVAFLLSTLPGAPGPAPLAGLRVVADCAHGAAWWVGPEALRRAGAEVLVIGADPDGLNTNAGVGSTHLGPLREAVLAAVADAGVAFDGDADRCLALDADGLLVDGDQVMGVLALAARDRGEPSSGTLVATVMSNLGLLLAMRGAGIEVVQTAVGDRYVLEAMRAGGHRLGGEQSGHVVMLDHQTTGDGVLTALHLLARVAEQGRPLSALAGAVTRLPQVLVNVPRVDRARAGHDPEVLAAVRAAEAELGDTGRVLLRPSGTEPLVRVMVEAPTAEVAERVAERLAGLVAARLAV